EEPLKTYTWNNANATIHEGVVGSIKVGQRADIRELSQDILGVPEENIPATRVVYTLVGGKVVYQRP
ncbi:MAG: amidohydrolase family protein, partial [Gammaproteobacteria bacterium]